MNKLIPKLFFEFFPQLSAFTSNRAIRKQREQFASRDMTVASEATISDEEMKDADQLVKQDDSVRETVSDKAKAGLFIIGIAVVSMVNMLNFEQTVMLSSWQRLLLVFGFLQLIFSTYCLVAAMFPRQWRGIFWSSLVKLSENNTFEPIKLTRSERYAENVVSTKLNEFVSLELANLVTAGYLGVRNSLIALFVFFLWMQFPTVATNNTAHLESVSAIERFLVDRRAEIKKVVVPQRGVISVIDPLAQQPEHKLKVGLVVYFNDGTYLPIKVAEAEQLINSSVILQHGIRIEFDGSPP